MRLVIVLLCLGACSCAPVALYRVQYATEPSAPPQIERIIDLGGLAQGKTGTWNRKNSDGRFSPGEWVAIVGSNLASVHTNVNIGGLDVPVEGYLEGGSILVRIPRHLPFLESTPLMVKTLHGLAQSELAVFHHIIMSDRRARALRFWQARYDNGTISVDAIDDIPLDKTACYALSPDGAFLFAVSAKAVGGSAMAKRYKLETILLSAPSGPAVVYQTTFESKFAPRRMAVSRAGDNLYLLTDGSLERFALVASIRPSKSGHIELSGLSEGDKLREFALVDNDHSAVILGPRRGDLSVVDLTVDSQLALSDRYEFKFKGGQSTLSSIDLAADHRNSSRFWVLVTQDWNLALNASITKSNAEPVPAVDSAPKPKTRPPAHLAMFAIDGGKIALEKKHPLDDKLVPFALARSKKGGVIVNAAHGELGNFADLKPTDEGLLTLLLWIKDAPYVGRIVHLNADGETKTLGESMSLFLTCDDVGLSNTSVFTTLRLKPRLYPPALGVELQVEIFEQSQTPIRRLRWTSLLPPYASPKITVQ